MFDLARSLESAAHSSEMYMATPPSFNAAILPADKALPDCDPTVNPSTLSTASSFLWYIDGQHHVFNQKKKNILDLFERFVGYNIPEVSKHHNALFR